MFGNIGQMMNLMKNAGQIQQTMKQMNEKLAAARVIGDAGGGQVQATVNGRGELVALKIDQALVTAGDVEMLEDLCVAAVRDATSRSRELAQNELKEITGGLNLPGMDKLLGG